MNGRNERLIVLDSNVVIDFINCDITSLPKSDDETVRYCVSVVTEMEALAKPSDSPETRAEIRAMLAKFIIVPLSDDVKTIATDIRRSGSPRPRLPDAIVPRQPLRLKRRSLPAMRNYSACNGQPCTPRALAETRLRFYCQIAPCPIIPCPARRFVE
jgi:predicted nucleic acid-binding protein